AGHGRHVAVDQDQRSAAVGSEVEIAVAIAQLAGGDSVDGDRSPGNIEAVAGRSVVLKVDRSGIECPACDVDRPSHQVHRAEVRHRAGYVDRARVLQVNPGIGGAERPTGIDGHQTDLAGCIPDGEFATLHGINAAI